MYIYIGYRASHAFESWMVLSVGKAIQWDSWKTTSIPHLPPIFSWCNSLNTGRGRLIVREEFEVCRSVRSLDFMYVCRYAVICLWLSPIFFHLLLDHSKQIASLRHWNETQFHLRKLSLLPISRITRRRKRFCTRTVTACSVGKRVRHELAKVMATGDAPAAPWSSGIRCVDESGTRW